MKPVILNKEGEQLMSLDDISEESVLTSFNAGQHSVCGGRMRFLNVSKTHNALVCPECFFRLVLPKKVGTYRALRAHLFSS